MTRTLITAADQKVLVTKKSYVYLFRRLAIEVQAARRDPQPEFCEVKDQKAREEQLELKVQILTDDDENVANLPRQLSVREVEFATTNSTLDVKKITLKANVWECNRLDYDLGSTQDPVG